MVRLRGFGWGVIYNMMNIFFVVLHFMTLTLKWTLAERSLLVVLGSEGQELALEVLPHEVLPLAAILSTKHSRADV